MKLDSKTKSDGRGHGREAWLRAEMASRRGYADAYYWRFAVFIAWVLLMAGLAWVGVCLAWEPFCAYQAREQERLDAEYEGLEAAYHAEALYCLELELDNMKGDAE